MIELRSSTLRATIVPRGAALAGFWTHAYPYSLILGAPNCDAYNKLLDYFGALVGPVANRIAGARAEIDGTEWRLEANEGKNTLHGGSNGLHSLVWDVVDTETDRVTFQKHLPHEFGGLPGNREIRVTYHLNDDRLRLEITAVSDRKTAINIAHHPYWNLDGAASVASHRLHVPASFYLPTSDENLPTGEIRPVEGEPYDFRKVRKVPTHTLLDANLCLRSERLKTPTHCATLSVSAGPRLEIFSTEPGLQVYNGTGLKDVPVPLNDDRRLGSCAGIALEPQGWPDALNQSQFPSVLVEANEQYRQVTEYRISQ